MNPSKNHNNWLTVGEIINLVRRPVALYADHVVKKWHKKLCQDCLIYGRCAKPEDCKRKTVPKNLCSSCKGWYQKLESSHRNRRKPSQIKWRQNCDTSMWPDDPWEVAKFFMSILGHNKSTVKNAESTDLSSLLNVLEWMEDVAFGGDRRVDLNLVRQLRSEVRNTWAHSPKQDMSDDQLNNSFEIVHKFLKHLDTVFSCSEVKECLKEIQFLQTNGLTNVAEAELKNLTLLRKELQADVSQMKEEIKTLGQDQTSNGQSIQENKNKLEKLEVLTEECSARMNEFHQWKERLDSLFNDMKLEMKNMRDETRKDIKEIRADVEKIQEAMNSDKIKPSSKLKSYLPDRPPSFAGRTEDVKEVRSFLEKKDSGIISIIGGPGFGKTTIAIQVSHLISSEHDIPVIYSHLSNASTKSEVVLRLCRDIGISPEEDLELSLLSWLRKMEEEVVLVMDNIEQLLEDGTRWDFIDLVRSIRKACSSLKIITTSRKALVTSDLKIQEVRLEEMNKECSMELVKSRCPELQFPDDDIAHLAKLCGHVPLALCIAASLLKDTGNIKKVIEWLKEDPMETLQGSDSEAAVRNVIQTSFNQLNEEDRKTFARLSVFNGHFSEDDAQAITERKKGPKTHNFLTNLFDRCLIQRNADRFSLHHLIKMFLVEKADFNEEKDRAKKLMVDYFLSLCHSLTLKYWSKDRFFEARRSLQGDTHNIEETLKLCQEAIKGPKISKEIASSLQESEIYRSSCRFFYRFIEYILAKSVTRGFLEACAKLAEESEDTALKINYNCLLASAIPHESTWSASSESVEILEKTKDIVDGRKKELERDNKLILAYFYDSYGRYVREESERFSEAGEYFEKALEMRQHVTENLERVDKVFTLMELGRYEKQHISHCKHANDRVREQYMNLAIDNHLKAIAFSEEILGDHSTTAKCYKVLGDCYFRSKKYKEALKYYNQANKIYDRFYLEGNFSPFFFYLLKMRGRCLHCLDDYEDAVKTCEDALALAKILDIDRCKAQAHFILATVLQDKWSHPDEQREHAKEAVRLQKSLWETDYEFRYMRTMKKIIKPTRKSTS